MKKTMMLCVALVLSNNIFAQEAPRKCPSASEIIKIGLSANLVQDNDGKWYAGRTAETYGTKNKWTFVIGEITAANKSDALTKAKQALQTLSFSSGPKKAPADKWLCLYSNSQNYLSGAVTPPINNGYPSIKFIK